MRSVFSLTLLGGLSAVLFSCGGGPIEAQCTNDDPGASWYPDGDGDGVGVAAGAKWWCEDPGNGWAEEAGDCDDADPDVLGELQWFYDDDDDGFGAGEGHTACTAPLGYVDVDGDCDDADATIAPGMDEACDNKDNDCDDEVDEGADTVACYLDNDLDGYGDMFAEPLSACEGECPDGTVTDDATDCDDGDFTRYPGAFERCDGKDNDCDESTVIDLNAVGCPLGVEVVQASETGVIYLLATEPATFGELRNYCGDRGYRVVWIEDAAEASFLSATLMSFGVTDPAWTGIEWSTCSTDVYERVDPTGTMPVCEPLGAWDMAQLPSTVGGLDVMFDPLSGTLVELDAPLGAPGVCELLVSLP